MSWAPGLGAATCHNPLPPGSTPLALDLYSDLRVTSPPKGVLKAWEARRRALGQHHWGCNWEDHCLCARESSCSMEIGVEVLVKVGSGNLVSDAWLANGLPVICRPTVRYWTAHSCCQLEKLCCPSSIVGFHEQEPPCAIQLLHIFLPTPSSIPCRA